MHGKRRCFKRDRAEKFHVYRRPCGICDFQNAANDVMEYYNEQHGMQCASFRLPPVYGVGPHSEIYVNGKYYKTGIQTFIENAEAGKTLKSGVTHRFPETLFM